MDYGRRGAACRQARPGCRAEPCTYSCQHGFSTGIAAASLCKRHRLGQGRAEPLDPGRERSAGWDSAGWDSAGWDSAGWDSATLRALARG